MILAACLPFAASPAPLATCGIATAAVSQQDPAPQGPTTQDPATQDTPAKQTERTATAIFLRHAEAKPRTRDNQNPDLAEAGRARAERIANTLRAAAVTRIFATELSRTQQTAAPLAKSLGLTIEPYEARKSKAFANTLRSLKHGEVVVVVGHSNTVPLMVKELGGKLTGLDGKGYLQDTEHDRMIVQVLASQNQEGAMRAMQTLDLRIQ
jgi:phosphohistidine phosphatase SixA